MSVHLTRAHGSVAEALSTLQLQLLLQPFDLRWDLALGCSSSSGGMGADSWAHTSSAPGRHGGLPLPLGLPLLMHGARPQWRAQAVMEMLDRAAGVEVQAAGTPGDDGVDVGADPLQPARLAVGKRETPLRGCEGCVSNLHECQPP